MNPSSFPTPDIVVQELTTTTTTTSQPLQQWGGPPGYYPGYHQYQQQAPSFQNYPPMYPQNYPQTYYHAQNYPQPQWDDQQHQQWQQQQQQQQAPPPPNPTVDNFNLDLFSPPPPPPPNVSDEVTVCSPPAAAQAKEPPRAGPSDTPGKLLWPDCLVTNLRRQRREVGAAQEVLEKIQDVNDKVKEEETKFHGATLPPDLADFLKSAACLKVSRKVELEKKVVKLQVELQEKLVRMAQEEVISGREAEQQLTQLFQELALKYHPGNACPYEMDRKSIWSSEEAILFIMELQEMAKTPLRDSETNHQPLTRDLQAVLTTMMRCCLDTFFQYATLRQMVELQDGLSGANFDTLGNTSFDRVRYIIWTECQRLFRAAHMHPQVTTLFWRHCKPAMRFWSVHEGIKRCRKK